MTINLETNLLEQAAMLDETLWTELQTEICMNVATAKYRAFVAEAERNAEYVRLGFVSRADAGDYLHVTAIYNSLYAEYGRDQVQGIIAAALGGAA